MQYKRMHALTETYTVVFLFLMNDCPNFYGGNIVVLKWTLKQIWDFLFTWQQKLLRIEINQNDFRSEFRIFPQADEPLSKRLEMCNIWIQGLVEIAVIVVLVALEMIAAEVLPAVVTIELRVMMVSIITSNSSNDSSSTKITTTTSNSGISNVE